MQRRYNWLVRSAQAANERAPRNSDKQRDAHLIYPPKPNTWGEHCLRALLARLRSGGGGGVGSRAGAGSGMYAHYAYYDHACESAAAAAHTQDAGLRVAACAA